jgi:hypothetical protein
VQQIHRHERLDDVVCQSKYFGTRVAVQFYDRW